MADQEQENKPVQEPDKKTTELDECRAKCDEYLNGWKRAKADFINYKRDESQRLQEMARYTKESFLENILPMIDNLCLVQKQMPKDLQEDSHVKGLLMVKVQLEDFLKSQGVEAIDSMGKRFDPAVHEVIQAVDASDSEPGTIIEEIERGYVINGRLLRPAKVKVAK